MSRRRFEIIVNCTNCGNLWRIPEDAPPVTYCRYCLTPSAEMGEKVECDGRIEVEMD